MQTLILSIEPKTATTLKKNLKYENINADIASTPDNVFLKLFSANYECILIKESNPAFNTCTLTLKVRQLYPDLPIIILANKKDKNHTKKLFISGVNAFFAPPYSWSDITKRIQDLVSHKNIQKFEPKILTFQDITINLSTRQVTRNHRTIQLKNKEFNLLEFMIKNANQVLTRNNILENVWDRNISILTNTIDVHINQLRHKIDHNHSQKLIHTIHCVGYKFGKQ